MQISRAAPSDTLDIITLCADAFTASEGIGEGARIRAFVQYLLRTTAPDDLFVFIARTADGIVGAACLSRMRYQGDARDVFILSPVAVRPDVQRTGVGTAMLTQALDQLRADGVDVALTYGAPDYYARVGFAQITPETAAPPFALSYPHGWLGQSLRADTLGPLIGSAQCVPALNTPDLW